MIKIIRIYGLGVSYAGPFRDAKPSCTRPKSHVPFSVIFQIIIRYFIQTDTDRKNI